AFDFALDGQLRRDHGLFGLPIGHPAGQREAGRKIDATVDFLLLFLLGGGIQRLRGQLGLRGRGGLFLPDGHGSSFLSEWETMRDPLVESGARSTRVTTWACSCTDLLISPPEELDRHLRSYPKIVKCRFLVLGGLAQAAMSRNRTA